MTDTRRSLYSMEALERRQPLLDAAVAARGIFNVRPIVDRGERGRPYVATWQERAADGSIIACRHPYALAEVRDRAILTLQNGRRPGHDGRPV